MFHKFGHATVPPLLIGTGLNINEVLTSMIYVAFLESKKFDESFDGSIKISS
jgi:hypothetical protein